MAGASRFLHALAAALWLALAPAAAAQETKNVLVIYGNSAELPWIKIFDASLRSAATGTAGQHVEFYTEYFDIARFPGSEHNDAFIALMRARYAGRRIDVLVSGGHTMLDFLVNRRKDFFPDVPLVYSFLPPDADALPRLPPGVFGVPVDFSPLPTIELALRLHPGTKRLVLVTGAGPWDLPWEKRLRRDTAALRGRLEIEFLAQLPAADVFARLRALPEASLVFTPGFFHDGTGAVFTPRDTVEAMAASSAAPLYVPYETQIGTGAVGGVVPSFDAAGRQAGEIVAALLEGRQPAALERPRAVPGKVLVDWRQLRRWGIDERALPPGTLVEYRERSVWDDYWQEIAIGIAVVLLQAVLITLLLFERRNRRQTGVALEKSEQRVDLAARAARLSMWYWEVAGDKVRATAPLLRSTGAASKWSGSAEEALASVHPADREQVLQAGREALAKGTEFNIEYRVVRPDGAVRWIAARGRAEKASDNRLVGVSMDITERKAAELQAAQDRANLRHMARVSMLGQLSAAIAHQMNQPLAAILGNAEAARKMLDREQVDLAELREICDDIVSEDNRAAEVIRRLRELYKRGETKRELVDLNALVRETLDLLRAELLTRHVITLTDLATPLPQITAGRVQLQQVLLNLVLNAADAMSEGKVEERIVTLRTELVDGEILLCVADRGPGIRAEDLGKVFEGFWSTKAGGMGVGLAICKSILVAHGGGLKAFNNPDGGASFCANLPTGEET